MIPRYRTNLAKSIKFGMGYLKFVTNNGNSNTAYFIFTDGMDENLYFGKEFKTHFLIIIIYLLDLFLLNLVY